MSDLKIKISAEIDESSIGNMTKQLKGIQDGVGKIKIDVDTNEVMSRLSQLESKMKPMDLKIDTAKAKAALVDVDGAIQKFYTTSTRSMSSSNSATEKYIKTMSNADRTLKQVTTTTKDLEGNVLSVGTAITKNFSHPIKEAQTEALKLNKNFNEIGQGLKGNLSSDLQKLSRDFKDIASPEAIGNIDKMIKSLDFSSPTFNADVNKIKNSIKSLGDESKVAAKEMKEAFKVGNLTGEMDSKLGNLSKKFRELVNPSDISRVKDMMAALDPSSITFAEEVKKINNEIKAMGNSAKETQRDMKAALKFENDTAKLSSDLERLKRDFKGVVDPRTVSELEQMIDTLNPKSLTLPEDLTKVRNSMVGARQEATHMKREMGGASTAMGGFGKAMGGVLKKAVGWVSLTMVIRKAFREIQKGVQIVKDVDSAMVELKRVTNATEQEYTSFMKTSFQLGKELGKSGTDVIKATADFSRMGFEMKDAAELAQEALLMVNVGDGVENVEQASTAIITALKGFKVESEDSVEAARHINDAYNEVANNFAVDTASIAEAVKKSSAIMSASGNDIDQTIGLVTGAFEVLQDSSKVSSGLNIIAQRLKGINDEGKDSPELVAKLKNEFKDIANIDLEQPNGDLKDTYTILEELAAVYPDLSSKQRAYLAELAAGKRQSVVLESLMSNWENVAAATKTATDAAGSAMAENEKYMDSIEGKLGVLEAAKEQFWSTLINSGAVKSLVDTGSTIFEGLTKIIEKLKGVKEYSDIEIPGLLEDHGADLQYLEEIQGEFEYLNALVGENGGLSRLTAEQKNKYLEMTEKLHTISPDMEVYYNSQGELIAGTTTEIEKLIDAKQREMNLDKKRAQASIDERVSDYKKEAKKNQSKEEKLKDKIAELERKETEDVYSTDLYGNKKYDSSRADKFKEQREKAEAELLQLEFSVSESMEGIKEGINSNLFLIGDSFEVFKPQIDGFKQGFANMLEMDSSPEGVDNAVEAMDKLKAIYGEIQESLDTGGVLPSSDSIVASIGELTALGMGYEDVADGIFRTMSVAKSGEAGVAAIDKAIQELNETGKITGETLQDSFENVSDGTKEISVEMLQQIAKTDEYAAAILGMSYDVGASVEGLVKDIKKSTESLDISDIVKPEGLIKAFDEIGEASKNSVEQISSDAERQSEIYKYLYEDLGFLTEKQYQELMDSHNQQTADRLSNEEKVTAELINQVFERGQAVREDLEKSQKALEEADRDINSVFGDMDASTKEFLIEILGVDDLENNLELVEAFLQGEDVKEIIVQGIGFDIIKASMDELGEKWEGLSTDEQVFVATMVGFSENDPEKLLEEWESMNPQVQEFISEAIVNNLEETVDFIAEWQSLDPETMTFIAEQAGIEDVENATKETMAEWIKDPKVKMFLALEEGLENVRSERDKTNKDWASPVEPVTFQTKEEGGATTRSSIQQTLDLWNPIPTLEVKTQQTVFETVFKTRGEPSGPTSWKDFEYHKNWTGNDNFEGGLSFVGEKGRELLVYPDGSHDMTGERTELRNLPRGTKIYNNSDTENILAGNMIPKFDSEETRKILGSSTPQFHKGNAKGEKIPQFADGNTRATADKYAGVNVSLERFNFLLKRNKILQESAKDGTAEKIKLLKEELKLEEQHRELLNDKLKISIKERNEQRESLKQQGFKFEGYGFDEKISNLGNIEGKSKEIEEIFDKYNELQFKTIPSIRTDMLQISSNINKATSDGFVQHTQNVNYLAENSHLLKMNAIHQTRSNEGLAIKVDLLKEETELHERTAELTRGQADILREERKELEANLKLEGAIFEGIGDSRRIKSGTEDELIKGKAKEIEEQFNRYNELQFDLIPKITIDEMELEDTIRGMREKIHQANMKYVQEELDVTTKLQDEIRQEKASLSDTDFSGQLDVAQKIVEKEKEKYDFVKATIKGLQGQLKLEKEGSDVWDMLNASINDFESKLRDSNLVIKDMIKDAASIEASALVEDFDRVTSLSRGLLDFIGVNDNESSKAIKEHLMNTISKSLTKEIDVINNTISDIELEIVTETDPTKLYELEARLSSLTGKRHQVRLEVVEASREAMNRINAYNSGLKEAVKSGEDLAKLQEEARLRKYLENADVGIQGILDEIDLISHQIGIIEDGKSMSNIDIEYGLIPNIQYKTPDEAVKEAVENSQAAAAEIITPIDEILGFIDEYTLGFHEKISGIKESLKVDIFDSDTFGKIDHSNVGEYLDSIDAVDKAVQDGYKSVKSLEQQIRAMGEEAGLPENIINDLVLQGTASLGGYLEGLESYATEIENVLGNNLANQITVGVDALAAAAEAGKLKIVDGLKFDEADISEAIQSINNYGTQLIGAIEDTTGRIGELEEKLKSDGLNAIEKAELGSLKEMHIELVSDFQINKQDFQETLNTAVSKFGEDVASGIKIELEPEERLDEAKFNSAMAGINEQLSAAGLEPIELEFSEDMNVGDLIAIIQAQFEGIELPELKVEADLSSFTKEMEEAVSYANGEDVTIKVKGDTESAVAEVESFLSTYDGRPINLSVEASTSDAASAISSLISSYNNSNINLNVGTAASNIPRNAKGDDNFQGGLSIVSELGREMIVTTDGRISLTGDEGSELMNIEKGSTIIPNDKTEKILKNLGVPAYAKGKKGKYDFLSISNNSSLPQPPKTKNQGAYDLAWLNTIKGNISGTGDDRSELDLLGLKKKLYQEVISAGNDIIDELYGELELDVDGKIVDTADNKAIADKINNIIKSQQSAQNLIKDTTKAMFESEFKQLEKLLQRHKEVQEEAQYQLDMTGDDDLERKLELLDKIADSERDYSNELQRSLYSMKDQLLTLEEGSFEWNILNNKIKDYEKSARDSNLEIKKNIEERYALEFRMMDKVLDKQREAQDDAGYRLDMLEDDDYKGRLDVSEKIFDMESAYFLQLQKNVSNLKHQLSGLKEGSFEWTVVNDKLKDYNNQLKSSNLELKNMRDQLISIAKEQAEARFDVGLENAELNIFGGKTEEDAKQELDDKIKAQEEFISGEEKVLEIAKIRKLVQEDGLKLTHEQQNILNQGGEVERAKLERLEKQLQVQQLQAKLSNLENQKTIRQLTKNDDGTFGFEYVADKKAIQETQSAILDSKKDLASWELQYSLDQDRKVFEEKQKLLAVEERKLQAKLDREKEAIAQHYQALMEKQMAMMEMNMALMEQLNSEKSIGGWAKTLEDVMPLLDELGINFAELMENLGIDLSENFEIIFPLLYEMGKLNEEMVEGMGIDFEKYIDAAIPVLDELGIDHKKFVEFMGVDLDKFLGDSKLSFADYLENVRRKNLETKEDVEATKDALRVPTESTHTVHLDAPPPFSMPNSSSTHTVNTVHRSSTPTQPAPASFDTGGKTPAFSGGRIAMLHEKEIVLNKSQSATFEKLIDIMPNIVDTFNDIGDKFKGIAPKIPKTPVGTTNEHTQETVQNFNISKLEFPNVKDGKDLQEAILKLPMLAKQRVRAT